ncbi:MAG: response regulator [Myxococcales bacterium]
MVQSTTIDRFTRPAAEPARASIMLIEDNTGLRDSLGDFLEEGGYEVDKCVDLHEALVLLELGYTPDLMVVDDAGIEGDGWLARLRSVRDARAARVPLVTLSNTGLAVSGRGSEVDAALPKPVHPELLLQTVAQLLAAAEEDRISGRALELQRLTALGGISAGLANELNNPVSFVVGHLELARKKCHELAGLLGERELSLLHEVERLIHHGLRGASRVGDVVQSAAGIPRAETGRGGAIDLDYDGGQNGESAAGFGARTFGREGRVRYEPGELRGASVASERDSRSLVNASQEAPAAPRSRILVIDDEALMCELLATMLSEDYDVQALANAREALNRISGGETYDLILCDLMMPELTGMDLWAELSRSRPDQASRMVFMTGGTFTDRAQQFLAEHGRVQLQKPFRHDELLSLVHDQLETHERAAKSNLH